jgi:hypothetical protein
MMPDTYARKLTDDFHLWWFQVRNNLDYYLNKFETNQDCITRMAGILEMKALAWDENRGIELDVHQQKHTWPAFFFSFSEHFIDLPTASKFHNKMSNTWYLNHNQYYLRGIDTLNL